MSRRSVVTTLAVLIVSFMTLGGIVLATMSGGRGGFGLGGRIAVLSVDGVIQDDEELLEQLRDFRDDGSVRGYVIQINSPGGVVAPSQSLYRELSLIHISSPRDS